MTKDTLGHAWTGAIFRDKFWADRMKQCLQGVFSFVGVEVNSSHSISRGHEVMLSCRTKEQRRQIECFVQGFLGCHNFTMSDFSDLKCTHGKHLITERCAECGTFRQYAD